MRHALALLMACFLWLAATPAAGQGMNDIPSPDEIRDTKSTPLRVDWPPNGEVVKVPFTITGVAAPGARLEIWIGGELERKFIADANGRFNTPVSKPTDGEIEIRHVGANSAPLQSVNVSVVFAGAAGPVAAGPKTGAPDPAPVTGGDPDPIDPFAEAKPQKTTSGLPRVSDLDGGMKSGFAPAPPPPSASSAFGTDGTTAPAAGDPVEELEVAAPVPRKRTPSRTTRYFAESGMGVIGGLLLGFGGVMLGGAIGLASGDPFAAIGFAAIGGLTGAVVGIPLGVVLTGNALDGNGKWWAAVLGELGGVLVATGLSVPYVNATFDGTIPVILFMTLPALGAAAGYELTSDPSAQDAEARQSVRLTPAVGRTLEGDPTYGLQLQLRF